MNLDLAISSKDVCVGVNFEINLGSLNADLEPEVNLILNVLRVKSQQMRMALAQVLHAHRVCPTPAIQIAVLITSKVMEHYRIHETKKLQAERTQLPCCQPNDQDLANNRLCGECCLRAHQMLHEANEVNAKTTI
jgi:hypothetical protein